MNKIFTDSWGGKHELLGHRVEKKHLWAKAKLRCFYDLTKKEQADIDYLQTEDEKHETRFFRFSKQVYDINDFLRVQDGSGAVLSILAELAIKIRENPEDNDYIQVRWLESRVRHDQIGRYMQMDKNGDWLIPDYKRIGY